VIVVVVVEAVVVIVVTVVVVMMCRDVAVVVMTCVSYGTFLRVLVLHWLIHHVSIGVYCIYEVY
jgi:hypothetical protein